MGKWTPNYYDDVLHSKMKSLVSGAIKRSKLEETEPEISYESFVEDLDIGDSFTTILVENLVKELADRRTRANVEDRRLIGERTARSLRTITGRSGLYLSSMTRRASARRLPMYITSPPEEMDVEEDEDEFDTLIEHNNPNSDSTRRQDAIFEAYTQSVPTSSASGSSPSVLPYAARSSSPAPFSPPDEALGTSVPYSRPWFPARSYVTSLNRQSSIRRPSRSRTVDFNDFTSRRRSTIRNAADTATSDNSTSNPRESAWVPAGTRRFFPGLRGHRRTEPDIQFWSDLTDGDAEAISAAALLYPSSPRLSPASLSNSNDNAETSDARNSETAASSLGTLPRLRRGGLRAPESMLSRQDSPVDALADDDSRRAPSPPEISEYIEAQRSAGSGITIVTHEGATYGIEAAAYPTPGSVDNENSS